MGDMRVSTYVGLRRSIEMRREILNRAVTAYRRASMLPLPSAMPMLAPISPAGPDQAAEHAAMAATSL
jgi:hypothetical protein